MDNTALILPFLLTLAPTLVVYIIFIAIAANTAKFSKQAKTLFITALAVLSLDRIISTAISYFITINGRDFEPSFISLIVFANSAVSFLLLIAALVLIYFAIYNNVAANSGDSKK